MPLIKGHEQRFVKTQMAAWGKIIYPSLEKIIRNKNVFLKNEIPYKCRVVYDSENIEISFTTYQKRAISILVLKECNDIDYHFKYENRESLNFLAKDLHPGEEVLIVKNNFIAETSFTNIALWNGKEWHTPKRPLLDGVQRSKLLLDKIISEKNISVQDLTSYQKIRLFNARVNWDEAWELSTKQIRTSLL
jgi:4-amino-4-deoxychorismate lyase